MAWSEAYLRTKLHLDPYNRLATINVADRQTDRQTGQDSTGQDRQRSDSIGRTVLQTVGQKLVKCEGEAITHVKDPGGTLFLQ